jgi:hypothetical protein
LLRWLVVVGALFAVTLFGGSSCADGPLTPPPASNYAACPNVILQVSLPGAMSGGDGSADGTFDAVADAGVFLVVALAVLALTGGAGRLLLGFLAFWWARMPLRRRHPRTTAGSMRMDPLRI